MVTELMSTNYMYSTLEYYTLDSLTMIRHKQLLLMMGLGWYNYECDSEYHHHNSRYRPPMPTMPTIIN
jgi:hypothetical protein